MSSDFTPDDLTEIERLARVLDEARKEYREALASLYTTAAQLRQAERCLAQAEQAFNDFATPERILSLVSQAKSDVPALLTDALDMADGRGWAMEWPDRYANLVLEASEFTEAWRGKKGDPVKEAGDVLLTYLLVLGAAGVSWDDAFAACSAKVAEFRTRPPYHGEFTAAHRARASLPGEPAHD